MWRQKRQAAILKAMGVKKGFPDILIFDRPPARPGYVGVALEMKRARGGRLSAEQEQWLAILRFLGWYTDAPAGADAARQVLGWYTSTPEGADAARQVLEELGFDTP